MIVSYVLFLIKENMNCLKIQQNSSVTFQFIKSHIATVTCFHHSVYAH